MEPQIIIPAQLTAFTSGFLEINQQLLPATLQADGLGAAEIVTINSLSSFATAILSLTAIFDDGDTITIGPRTYTFQDILTDVDGNVLIDQTVNPTIANLINAINLGPGAGSEYAASTTENTEVSGAVTLISGQMIVTAKVSGEAGKFMVSDASIHASWGTSSLELGPVPVFEGGAAVELTETNNRMAVNSPLRIQAVKEETAGAVTVSVAYGNKV